MVIPNWFRQNRVAITRLDLQSCPDCIVGQLEAENIDVETRLGAEEYDPRFGFDIDGQHGREEDYARLDDLWKDEIRARRAAV